MVGRSRLSWVSERDPDLGDLRKAARTALLLPILFAFGLEVLGNESFALFAGFGIFAMLSFADFGGPLGRRTRAYVVFALAGAGIVAIGTLTSQSTLAAAAGTFLVILLIQQVAVFGGYWASATIPATLAFVLAVMIPSPAAQLLPQAAGWLAAGALSAVGAVLLWPRRTRRQIAEQAAEVTDQLAALLSRWEDDPSAPELRGALDDLATAVRKLMRTWDVYRIRPGGPAVHDQALIYLVDQVRQLLVFARALVAGSAPPDGHETGPAGGEGENPIAGRADGAAEHRRLVAVAVGTMRATSTLLRGGPDGMDLRRLAEERAADLAKLEADLASSMRDGDGDEAVGRADRSFAVRMLVHATLSMAANARLMAGGQVDDVRGYEPPPTVPEAGSSTTWQRGVRILRSHLSLRSVWFRNTVRASVAITLAVVVARTIEVEHGFWVALGTLSVLRSSASGTAANAAQAVAGTVIGFAVTVPILVAVDGSTTALWVLLPITTFLSAWTPRVVHFVVGQASFTLFVVVLFNLVEPVGWQAGLVRVEDIVLGVLVAVVVGLVMWPRGVVTQMGAVVGKAYEAVASYIGSSFSLTVAGPLAASGTAPSSGEAEPCTPADVERSRQTAFTAIVEADEAVMLARAEGRAEALPQEEMDLLLIGLARLRHTGDALGWIRSGLPPVKGCERAVAALGDLVARSCASVSALGGSLREGSEPPDLPPGQGTSVSGVLADLAGDSVSAGCDTDATTVMALTFATRWLQVDEEVLERSRTAATAVVELGRRPLWR